MTVTGVTLRDCDNAALSAFAGPPALLTVDNTPPAAIVLSAAQRKSGNGTDGTTAIQLSWPAVEAGASVELWRKGFGHYPEYDDPPGAGSAPTLPVSHPPAGWTLAATVSGGATTYADEPASRDFWSYLAYVEDACGNVGPVSNLTGGTLNYHLGDTHNGTDPCVGDNAVSTSDLSFLGAHYGATLADPDVLGCLDVGPTTDYSVDARPATDNLINFEDLMMFAINHGVVSAPQFAARHELVAADRDEIEIEAPATVRAGDEITAIVRFRGTGAVRGVSLVLGWDTGVLEALGHESGGALVEQGGVLLSAAPGRLDAAVLGVGAPGLTGAGDLALVRFHAKASGSTGLGLLTADARDAGNHPAAINLGVPAAAIPTVTRLAPAQPNPFTRATQLSFTLARGGAVDLSIYGVDGRRVKTLVRETRVAGESRVSWDGTDDAGRAAAPGVYFARLTMTETRLVRILVRLK